MSKKKGCDRCDMCQKEKDTSVNAAGNIECRLCGEAVYCGDECASVGWAVHSAECNVHTVPTLGTVVAMPYLYQDLVDDKHFSEADLRLVDQSHLMHHINPSGLISARVTEFAAPTTPSQLAVPAKISLRVNDKVASAAVMSKAALIEPRAPGVAGKLAAIRATPADKNLWIPLAAPLELDPSEPLTVSLFDEVSSKVVASMVIKLPPTMEPQEISRMAKAPILSQFQEKRLSNVASLVPMVAQNETSTVRMIFNVANPDTPKLVDIEFQLCGASSDDWSAERFQCNARDIDHVTGLLMAVSDRIQQLQGMEEDTSKLEADYNLIHDHLEAMHAGGKAAEPSPFVNAAITRCTQQQFEAVGLRTFKGAFKEYRQRRKMKAEESKTTVAARAEHQKRIDGFYAAKDMPSLVTEVTYFLEQAAGNIAKAEYFRGDIEIAEYALNKIIAMGSPQNPIPANIKSALGDIQKLKSSRSASVLNTMRANFKSFAATAKQRGAAEGSDPAAIKFRTV
jgi:hypothetical protein